jgi:hypothetical protein
MLTGEAVNSMLAVVDALEKRNLKFDHNKQTEQGASFVWENGFNKTHRAEIICFNSGAVVGTTSDTEAPDTKKVWFISDLSAVLPVPEVNPLLLTLDESLEFVRHWIWANHNV